VKKRGLLSKHLENKYTGAAFGAALRAMPRPEKGVFVLNMLKACFFPNVWRKGPSI
jgi:hypothetical protein